MIVFVARYANEARARKMTPITSERHSKEPPVASGGRTPMRTLTIPRPLANSGISGMPAGVWYSTLRLLQSMGAAVVFWRAAQASEHVTLSTSTRAQAGHTARPQTWHTPIASASWWVKQRVGQSLAFSAGVRRLL